jgi:hypothetical protein
MGNALLIAGHHKAVSSSTTQQTQCMSVTKHKELSISCHCSDTTVDVITYLSDAIRIQIVFILKCDFKFAYKTLSTMRQKK